MINLGFFLFFSLSFAHCLTEFSLHPRSLRLWEKRSSWGIIFHCFIFGMTGIIFLLPFLNQGLMWWYIIFLAAMHFFIDHFKYSWLNEGKDSDAVFLLDQIAHFFWIGLVAYYGAGELKPAWLNLGEIYRNFWLPLGLLIGVLILSYRQILQQWRGEG